MAWRGDFGSLLKEKDRLGCPLDFSDWSDLYISYFTQSMSFDDLNAISEYYKEREVEHRQYVLSRSAHWSDAVDCQVELMAELRSLYLDKIESFIDTVNSVLSVDQKVMVTAILERKLENLGRKEDHFQCHHDKTT